MTKPARRQAGLPHGPHGFQRRHHAIGAVEPAAVGLGVQVAAHGDGRQIVAAAAIDGFDLLAMGAQGLGATPGASVGSVCERVARRAGIDDALRAGRAEVIRVGTDEDWLRSVVRHVAGRRRRSTRRARR